MEITGNETITLDFSLESSVIAIDNEAIVEVRQNRSSTLYMENIKKKESTMIDYVSSQDIKKNGDSDVSSAIKRVSGVYTIGNFVVVRSVSCGVKKCIEVRAETLSFIDKKSIPKLYKKVAKMLVSSHPRHSSRPRLARCWSFPFPGYWKAACDSLDLRKTSLNRQKSPHRQPWFGVSQRRS